MLKLGNKSISNLFIGQKAATKAFLGQKLVWQKATGLPYDAEVEYLESTGTQWIDTGVSPNRLSDSFDIRVMIMSATTSYSSFCGSQDSSVSDIYYTLGSAASSSSVRFLSPVCGPVDVPAETWMDIHIANGDVSIAGNRFTPTMASGIFQTHFGLFGRMAENRIISSGAFRIASLSYYKSSVLVRDFIPVRVGGVGYMYDRVSKQLFGNQGSGNFIVGPDIVEVEYLESDGAQYIDTGVYLKYSDIVEVTASINNRNSIFGYVNGPLDQSFNVTGSGGNSYAYFGSGTSSFGSTPTTYNTKYVFNLGDGKFIIDDDIKGTKTYTDDTLGGTCYLFARNNNGVNDALNGKIYSFSVSRDGIKILDLIPVRVGMEGAMMDRLTRKIYRNAGTGAFKIGADKKETPLMCNSYIKDGLVAMWDGVENSGWGTHDANATVWKDLVGSKNLTIGSDVTKAFFKSNALYRTPELGDLATDSFITYPCTISITMYVDDGIAAGANPRFFSCTKSGNQGTRREFDCYNQNQVNAPRFFEPVRIGRFGRLSTGLWVISCICSDSTNVKFVDSVCDKYVETTLNEKQAPFLLNIGAWNSTSSAMMGDYYCVRLYSRALTAEEIAWNYEIDKRRFNLT